MLYGLLLDRMQLSMKNRWLDGTVDLLVIRNGKPDLSVRVSDRSGMAVLRSEISNVIQQNYGIHLDSSDVE